MLGLAELKAGHQDNVMAIEPVYIRRSEAEVLWEKRHPEEAGRTRPTEEM
jgi:tRNA threonylcarbamoyladenosine biosynthesis protein TsaB